MAKSAETEPTREDILAAIKAIRPGVILPLGGEGKKAVKVRVRDLSLNDIEEFSIEIGEMIPEIMELVGTIITKNAEDGKLTYEELKNDPELINNVLKKPDFLARLVPLFIRRLSDIIDRCVIPNGVFKEMPHDLAAPVVRTWIELNFLQEGKVRAWMDAIQGLGGMAEQLLPPSESS